MSSFKPPFQGRPSPFTAYTEQKTANPGKPFPKLQYCVRCRVSQTQEGVVFDELGVCQACQSAEQKIHINWMEREKDLRATLEVAKASAGNNYDCIIPISGGKDSTFQLHVLTKIYGMKPLAVTFSHNWFSETGCYNLQNSLEQFNVDHIMLTPNCSLVNRIAKHSLAGIGDSCWHCHAGVGTFPLQAAVHFYIPLLVWGESIAKSSGRASYKNPLRKFDREYFTKVAAKLRPDQMVRDDLSERDLYPFDVPSAEECEGVGVYGIHLGDYIFWDDERQTKFVRIPGGRLELRVPDASSNPYLLTAAIIHSGLDGIARKLEPGHPCNDSLYRLSQAELTSRGIARLPASLPHALDALQSDEVLAAGLGAAFVKEFCTIKQAECDELMLNVSHAEFRRYVDFF